MASLASTNWVSGYSIIDGLLERMRLVRGIVRYTTVSGVGNKQKSAKKGNLRLVKRIMRAANAWKVGLEVTEEVRTPSVNERDGFFRK